MFENPPPDTMPLRSRLRFLRIAAVAALAPGSLACSDPTAAGGGEPDLDGIVARVSSGDGQVSVLVDRLAVPVTGYSQIELYIRSVTADAAIHVRRADGTDVRGAPADLAVGARVLAWSTGVERRSNPPQWDARRVIIVSGSR